MSDLSDKAQSFLDFYVKGGTLPATGITFPGIRRRRPAVVGAAPEYDAIDFPAEDPPLDLLALEEIPPETIIPFNKAKAMPVDMCPAERVVVKDNGGDLEVILLLVRDYPSAQIPEEAKAAPDGRVFADDSGHQYELILQECVNRLWEFMAEDLEIINLDARTVHCSFEELDKLEKDVRDGEA